MHQNSTAVGAPPQAPWGAYSTLSDPLAEFKGLLLRAGESRGAEGMGLEELRRERRGGKGNR